MLIDGATGKKCLTVIMKLLDEFNDFKERTLIKNSRTKTWKLLEVIMSNKNFKKSNLKSSTELKREIIL